MQPTLRQDHVGISAVDIDSAIGIAGDTPTQDAQVAEPAGCGVRRRMT